MQTITVSNKEIDIIYEAVVNDRIRLERDHYGKGFEPYDELVALEASLLKQCPKFAEMHDNIMKAIEMHDVKGAKKACDVFSEWKNEDGQD